MTDTVVWKWGLQSGLEYCTVQENRPGFDAAGKIILGGEETLLAEYWIGCDTAWRTRRVYITVTQPEIRSVLVMMAGETGNWQVNGRSRPDLNGLLDIDLEITPLTNTLPIRRLSLAVNQSGEVTVAWVRFPQLTVEPLHQRYTRLGDFLYRYESLTSGFTADLEVDEKGLIVRYADLWKRL